MPYCSGYDTTLWVIDMLLNDRMNFCGTSVLVTAHFEGFYTQPKFIHGYWLQLGSVESIIDVGTEMPLCFGIASAFSNI